MQRLTKKVNKYYCGQDNEKSLKPLYDKLGQLEDLEEEIGCPLDVVFKAMKDGIWSVRYSTYQHSKINRFILLNGVYHLVVFDSYYDIKDYKKTWWLKEDRSE